MAEFVMLIDSVYEGHRSVVRAIHDLLVHHGIPSQFVGEGNGNER